MEAFDSKFPSRPLYVSHYVKHISCTRTMYQDSHRKWERKHHCFSFVSIHYYYYHYYYYFSFVSFYCYYYYYHDLLYLLLFFGFRDKKKKGLTSRNQNMVFPHVLRRRIELAAAIVKRRWAKPEVQKNKTPDLSQAEFGFLVL